MAIQANMRTRIILKLELKQWSYYSTKGCFIKTSFAFLHAMEFHRSNELHGGLFIVLLSNCRIPLLADAKQIQVDSLEAIIILMFV